jgi:hypothetical protein
VDEDRVFGLPTVEEPEGGDASGGPRNLLGKRFLENPPKLFVDAALRRGVGGGGRMKKKKRMK